MPRPPISGMLDHTARLWRPSKNFGELRERRDTLIPVVTFPCAVNRPSARLGNTGPGLQNVGERDVYTEPTVDLRARDVLELLTGPEAGKKVEIDEDPTNVRGHHLEARARITVVVLPSEEGGGGES